MKIPVPTIQMPDPPTAYCDLHHLDLSEGMMQRKDCVAKNCPHLSYTKIIIKYVGEQVKA